jgi:CDGSH-type Zn-finger protein
MPEPTIAQKFPYIWKAGKDEKVAWCRCGDSKKQPFCDGSHKGTDFRPIILDVKAGQSYSFCGCKRTGNASMCDGTHGTL